LEESRSEKPNAAGRKEDLESAIHRPKLGHSQNFLRSLCLVADDSSWMMMGLPSAKFFQLIETGSTLSDVSQCGRGVDGFGLGR
jgi:hypothetical protein